MKPGDADEVRRAIYHALELHTLAWWRHPILEAAAHELLDQIRGLSPNMLAEDGAADTCQRALEAAVTMLRDSDPGAQLTHVWPTGVCMCGIPETSHHHEDHGFHDLPGEPHPPLPIAKALDDVLRVLRFNTAAQMELDPESLKTLKDAGLLW